MFQFLTHVDLSRPMAAILEMPQYVAYRKIVAHIYISITVESLQLLTKCAEFTQKNSLSCPTIAHVTLSPSTEGTFCNTFAEGFVVTTLPSMFSKKLPILMILALGGRYDPLFSVDTKHYQ